MRDAFSRGLPAETADQFVGMYVNDWTVDMGERGQESIRSFCARPSNMASSRTRSQ